MNNLVEFDLIQRQQALTKWLVESQRRMGLKYPKIDFESDHWPIRTFYKTDQPDCSFTETFADFELKDRSFCDVVRCMMAEIVIEEKPKDIRRALTGFRLLKTSRAQSVFEVTMHDLRKIEEDCVSQAKANPIRANQIRGLLSLLERHIPMLSEKQVIPSLGFHLRHVVKVELTNLAISHLNKKNKDRSTILDRKIEAFNDAINALIRNDPRLSAIDRVALCASMRLMCAPSRINEILCSSIYDHVTVEDYAKKAEGKETDEMHRVHQMLLITTKGSKGAQWSCKPVLNFMIDAFHYSTSVIQSHGQRSRMLVEWYMQQPTKLYLPPELEYLRGRNLSRANFTMIVHLTEAPPCLNKYPHDLFNELKERHFKIPNPKVTMICGRRNPREMIDLVPWADAEKLLLQKVHKAIDNCRRVTHHNHYDGDLSKMLFLFDRDETPYLPYAVNYQGISKRLKRDLIICNNGVSYSLFEKLGITMPVEGEIQVAEIDTHDPRRWLTTMALRHGENLSDVLVNKWANRLSLAQLKAYDFRSAEEKAASSQMPEFNELTELSTNLGKVAKLEESFGLQPAIVMVHDAGVSVTSMVQIMQAVEDRPIAKTSEQIIILYPSRFGICLHQHHETPCRRYDPCLTCDRNICVKGHLPTNDEIRNCSEFVHKSIVRQLERLIPSYNRGVADHPEIFAEHLLMLIGKGLNLEQMADYLIDEFHQIRHQIKDKLLAKRIEEGFVAKDFVQRLDDDEVASGALMKYHNPTQHAAPGLEMALDSHGGREQVARDEESLIEKFPQFAPKGLGLKDQRHMIEADEGDDEE
jgi:hypothetical protein